VAISAQAADETDCGRAILSVGTPEFALYFLSHRLGLQRNADRTEGKRFEAHRHLRRYYAYGMGQREPRLG
jgi:hypothetical protein